MTSRGDHLQLPAIPTIAWAEPVMCMGATSIAIVASRLIAPYMKKPKTNPSNDMYVYKYRMFYIDLGIFWCDQKWLKINYIYIH